MRARKQVVEVNMAARNHPRGRFVTLINPIKVLFTLKVSSRFTRA